MDANQGLAVIKALCDKEVSNLKNLEEAANLIDAFNSLVTAVNFAQKTLSEQQARNADVPVAEPPVEQHQ